MTALRALLRPLASWSCGWCHAGPFPDSQFICSNCGHGKNG